jgi:NAD-dependent dihydropyrimidine dehydrogenase PreA subunit
VKEFRYIEETATLRFDQQTCIGCASCKEVCPHRIFDIREKKAVIVDKGACIECGACARNCPVEAIRVTPGVGCAMAIIAAWVNRLTGRQLVDGCC